MILISHQVVQARNSWCRCRTGGSARCTRLYLPDRACAHTICLIFYVPFLNVAVCAHRVLVTNCGHVVVMCCPCLFACQEQEQALAEYREKALLLKELGPKKKREMIRVAVLLLRLFAVDNSVAAIFQIPIVHESI